MSQARPLLLQPIIAIFVIGRLRSKSKQSCLQGLLFKHQAPRAGVQLITLPFRQIDDKLLKENWKEISGTLIFSLWTQDNEAWLNELVSNLSLMTLIQHSYLITGSCRRTHNPKCAFRSMGRLNNTRKISCSSVSLEFWSTSNMTQSLRSGRSSEQRRRLSEYNFLTENPFRA